MGYRYFTLFSFTLVFIHTSLTGGELKNLIPSRGELDEFRMVEKPVYYFQDNLWDYINGASPGYIASGFQEMVTFIVQHRQYQIEIVADIYDMGDTLNAFGIYSVERSPVGSDNALYFWQDRYYVKLMAYDISDKTAESLSLLAQIMTQKIPRIGGRPFLFSFFPESGRLPGSERYIKGDVLGQDYLSNGYTLEYSQENNHYQILLIHGKNRIETKQNFNKYLSFQKSTGQITEKNLKSGDQTFLGVDSFYGTITFSYKESFIIGILGVRDQKLSEDIINSMFSRIKNTPD